TPTRGSSSGAIARRSTSADAHRRRPRRRRTRQLLGSISTTTRPTTRISRPSVSSPIPPCPLAGSRRGRISFRRGEAMAALQPLAADQLWIADMDAQRGGFEFGARMTVVRLPGGELWLHSLVALTPELRQELDGLGPVRFLVAPNRLHYQHLAEFAS